MQKRILIFFSVLFSLTACTPQYYDVDFVLGDRISQTALDENGETLALPSIEENGSVIYSEELTNKTSEFGSYFPYYTRKTSLLTNNVFAIESKVKTSSAGRCNRLKRHFLRYLGDVYDQRPNVDGQVQFISNDKNRQLSIHCIKEDDKTFVTLQLHALDEIAKIDEHMKQTEQIAASNSNEDTAEQLSQTEVSTANQN